MKMKTSELSGAALNWVVAKCEGTLGRGDVDTFLDYVDAEYSYSTNWALAGPIIERMGINITLRYHPDTWDALIKPEFYSSALPHTGVKKEVIVTGPTPLIAAMRAYVKAKLGDEIDLPEELL